MSGIRIEKRAVVTLLILFRVGVPTGFFSALRLGRYKTELRLVRENGYSWDI